MTSPEIELIDAYNVWLLTAIADLDLLMEGLPRYISNETVLNEPVSMPWGGTLVGYEGWARLREHSLAFFGRIGAAPDMSEPQYWQRGTIVLREVCLTIRAAPGSLKPDFVMLIIEKYTVQDNRIVQIDEFYEDTARFLTYFET